MGWDNEIPRIRKKNWDMGEIINNLEESDKAIVPTDKTNSFRSVDTKNYMITVNEHLRISSKEIDRDKVIDIFEKSRELVEDFGFQLSKY